MFSITLALALAAAGVGLSDDTRLYYVSSDQTLQNIKKTEDFDAASPKTINADLGALATAIMRQLRLLGSIWRNG